MGPDDEWSLAPPPASSQASGDRLKPFTLTARQSQVPAPSLPFPVLTDWIDLTLVKKT